MTFTSYIEETKERWRFMIAKRITMLGGEILTEKFQTKEITGYVWIILA